eukprot:jgi/Picsp_1/891/NSC_04378-R1_regulator of the ubiquitin pathway (contains uas and ubx domains)
MGGEQERMVEEFVGVTDAPLHVARHILEAHGWDLDTSVSFYIESGGVGHGVVEDMTYSPTGHELQPTEEECRPEARQPRATRREMPIVVNDEDEKEEEEMMESDIEDEDGELRTLARHRTRRHASRMDYNENSDEEGADDSNIANRDASLRSLRRRRRRESRRNLRRSGRNNLRETSYNEDGVSEDDVEAMSEGVPLPDVNIEEQKMLMAALTGQIYEGALPDFTSNSFGKYRCPSSPGAIERQKLREEQDAALQESLALDREKARLKEQEHLEELEREESRRVEEDARVQALEQILEQKRAHLPTEPSLDDGDSFMLVVRMPGGSRLQRRFSKRDSVRAAFDFVDVEGKGEEVAPGTYRLVSQFPRRVFQEGSQSSFSESDLNHKQEALFVELL